MEIIVDDVALKNLEDILELTGGEYISNLKKLEAVIEQITTGAFQGDEADKFLSNYNDKKVVFKGLQQTLETVQERINAKKVQFDTMIETTMEEMR